jgi:hypothetical protein
MTARCHHTEDAAAWTLSALDDAQATEFATHLAGCGDCQAEVDQLNPAAQVLGMATPQVSPPDALRDRIMATVTAEAELLRAAGAEADRPVARAKSRRRFFPQIRPAFAAGVACVLIALGVAAGLVFDGGGSDTPTKTFQAKASGAMTGVATVDDDHVTLHLDGMKQPPKGRLYQVWLRRDGKVVPTDTLFAPAGGKATVTVDQSLDGADLVMITDEKMGGSEVPTGEASVQASLS